MKDKIEELESLIKGLQEENKRTSQAHYRIAVQCARLEEEQRDKTFRLEHYLAKALGFLQTDDKQDHTKSIVIKEIEEYFENKFKDYKNHETQI